MQSLKGLFLLIFLSLHQRLSTALFEGCDHLFNLQPGITYLESPYYPNNYPTNTSCRYKFKAPWNYGITVQCHLNIDKGSTGCSTEFFYLARDGDILLRGSEQFCGSGSFTRKSLFNYVTLAYKSAGASGIFRCSLTVQPQPCDCGWSVNTKIVNGKETNINEYPSMVALKDRTSKMPLYCSGAIVSPRFIVTAAHCARVQPNPAYIIILVGRHNIESRKDTDYSDVYYASRVIEHPNYTPEPTHNDIALIKTTMEITFRKGVGPICLPPLSNINNDFAYNEADVIGWGTVTFAGSNSPTLQKVTLLVVDRETCQEAFMGQDTIFPSHICTYDFTGKSKDSCQYDSGGPVIFKHKSRQFLIGVISFGKHCGAGGYATGVNERITSHLPWILKNTESTTCRVEM